jgi:hypothetical protein
MVGKIFISGFLGLSAFSNVYAKTCSEITHKEPQELGTSNVYRFEVTYRCEDRIPVNYEKLVAKHKEDILKRAQKVLEDLPQTTEEEHQEKLRIKERYKGAKGQMDLVNEYTIKTDKKSRFKQWDITKEITNATMDMRYTRAVTKTTTVKAIEGQEGMVAVIVSQIIDIEKPGIAPEGIFVTEAKKSLAENQRELMDKEFKMLATASH